MTTETSDLRGADPDMGEKSDIDLSAGEDSVWGEDDADLGEESYGFSHALWDGDEGTLTYGEREVLVLLLKHEFVSSDTYPHAWSTLVASLPQITSALHNLFLDLVVDSDREIAYKRPARTEDRSFPTLLTDRAHNREETLLLVFLRERFRAEGAAGITEVYVDVDDLYAHVDGFRPQHSNDEPGNRQKVKNAIDALCRAKLLRPTTTERERFRVSPAIETLLPLPKLQALVEALEAATPHTRDGSPDDEGAGNTPIAQQDDEDGQ